MSGTEVGGIGRTPWVVVLTAPQPRYVNEASFVLRALGIEHELTQLEGWWQLSVPAEHAIRASEELAAYRAEAASAPPPAVVEIDEIENGWLGVALYAAILLGATVVANQGLLGQDWLAIGRLDTDRVMAGQWWRTVTALCLHVDTAHLAGNLAFGGFFGLYAGRYLGSGVAWLGILVGGAAGNMLNAAIQPSGHLSIGASTAVFAALGLLAAYTWRRGVLKHTTWRARVAPITAALGLLAFTGTGGGVAGGNVDIVAHLTGFIAGLGIGALLATVPLARQPRAQAWAALAIAGILSGAWLWAVAAG